MRSTHRSRHPICRYADAAVTRDSLDGPQTVGTGPLITLPLQAGRLS